MKCSRCRKEHNRSGKYCLGCHAAYMRGWRKTHPLKALQRLKMNCRSYTSAYIKRGIIKKEPCEVCGSLESHPHHRNYFNPLDIAWLCKNDHKDIHRVARETFFDENIKDSEARPASLRSLSARKVLRYLVYPNPLPRR